MKFTITALLALLGQQPNVDPKPISFVACPIVRDTEEVPCWLADYDGKRYFLGIQSDLQEPFFPPQQLHQALVEGTPTGEMKCGGIVLSPVKVATLRELDPSCTVMLPAEGHRITGVRRGPGPDSEQLSALNQRRARQPIQYSAPFEQKSFDIFFDFDDDYMPSRSTRVITEAWRYATQSNARKVTVIGYRGAAKLSNGKNLVEIPQIAGERMALVKLGLLDLGVPADRVATKVLDRPERSTGFEDYKTRRVSIVVTP